MNTNNQPTAPATYLNVQEIIRWNPYVTEESLEWDEESREWLDTECGQVFTAA